MLTDQALYFFNSLTLTSVLFIIVEQFVWNSVKTARPARTGFILHLLQTIFACLITSAIYIRLTGEWDLGVYGGLTIATMLLASFLFLRNFSFGVKIFGLASLAVFASSVVWTGSFISANDFSIKSKVLLWCGLSLGTLAFPVFIKEVLLRASILGRIRWQRQPKQSQLQVHSRDEALKNKLSIEDASCPVPMVTVQVPCYSEPPEVVIETLNALSKVDYPNFEVMIIDNNTKDESLWRPLEDHCKKLGNKFRFFHIAPISGAKAGALNWAHQHLRSDCEILAVVDADYQVEPDFLRALVPLFKDQTIGFVQSSHDYRNWEDNPFKEACYWEYMPAYKLMLPSLSEWGAGYTVGTMCCIRKKTFEDIGGWATWCLTEDAELAVRVHQQGYQSIVLPDTFGRGLIPENFAEYKKQRFRWTAGPVQQLKHHFKTLIPFGESSALTFQQRFFELVHGGAYLPCLLRLIAFPLAFITFESIAAHSGIVELPDLAIFTLMAQGLALLAFSFFSYRALGASLRQMVLAQLAKWSLSHIQDLAVLKAVFSKGTLRWRRTSKFAETPNILNAIYDTQWEIVRGLGWLGMAAVLWAISGDKHMLKIGAIVSLFNGIPFLASTAMAMLAEHALIKTRNQRVAVTENKTNSISKIYS